MTPAGFRLPTSTRTLPTLDPPHEATRRALNALRAGRVTDALGLLNRLSKENPLEQAWSSYIEGRILVEQGDFAGGRAAAQHAASIALSLGLSDPIDPSVLRLAAAALESQGAALRRQDQPSEARRMHQAAFELRREYGSPDEQCESAMSMGSIAEWSGDWAAAEQWYRVALNLDVAKPEQAEQKSSALIRMSSLFTRRSRHDEAVESARSAQELLNEYLPGQLAAISAGLHTAHAMIRCAENQLGENPDKGLSILDEAAGLLQNTREDLSAFGEEVGEGLAWCNDQLNFIDRLRQTIRGAPTNE